MKIIKTTKKNSNSLTDQVYYHIRNALITGKIEGGTRLVESSLAADLGVGRTPVRETLHRLALEGLIYSIPRAGYIVEEMSDHDIQDLFTIRMIIEQIAAKLAVEKITEDELHRLWQNIKKSDELIDTNVTDKMTDLDIEFHGIIYKATRSKALYRICQTLSDHTLKYRIALIHIPEMAKKTRDGHYQIYKALHSGNSAEVDEAIRDHLTLAKEDIRDLLERRRQEFFLEEDLDI
jgi:DNA-binding GntR family transcriptional regulator